MRALRGSKKGRGHFRSGKDRVTGHRLGLPSGRANGLPLDEKSPLSPGRRLLQCLGMLDDFLRGGVEGPAPGRTEVDFQGEHAVNGAQCSFGDSAAAPGTGDFVAQLGNRE